ncbi:hypothetical protein FE257_000605 [Aspergillus nanangensis]|uniref:Rhodopsin domain-containing protein n=1 Tax=Aspergillus nanangensis TaxID=2582783 RepID=A0AAD4CEW7_ASPNN|nr:hypothetical protein FE257_000605 [Aspergillus nanangensis]
MNSLAGAVIAVNTTLLVFTFVVLALRVWSRVNISHNFAAEDIVMIISLLFFVAEAAISLSLLRHGLGKHVSGVQSEQPIVVILKISILLFYLKTFVIKAASITIMILIVITTIYTIACALALIFPCHPLARSWDLRIVHGYCINRFAVYYAQCGLNLFIDLALLILPLPLIWRLKVPA